MSDSETRGADLANLLTSFHGRIARKSWWIGYLIVVVASLSGTAVLDPRFFTAEELPPPSWPDTIWQLIWLVPSAAITVKRFNDRDWPWWLGYAAATLVAIRLLAPHLGLPIDPQAAGLGRTAFWVSTLLLTAVAIDNGFFRGTDGPNRYGPDPLQRNSTIP
jgi:uncharacterized membrane protein YhaH (DUF805 family)